MQGAVKKLAKVNQEERTAWAHDAMMRALRLAARNREDRAIVTAALSRAMEYDEMLAVTLAESERKRREAIGRANTKAARIKRAQATETVPCAG